jgi:hypothetical protein
MVVQEEIFQLESFVVQKEIFQLDTMKERQQLSKSHEKGS